MLRSSSFACLALFLATSRAHAQCPTFTPGTFRAPGTSGLVLSQVVFDDGNGPALYIGGGNAVDGAGITGVTRWDGVSMQALNGTIDPYSIYALCVFDEGNGPHLFAAGLWVQGANAFYAVCRRDGSDWTVLGGAADFNFSALMVFDEDGAGPATPELYAAGGFTSIGSVAVPYVARWNGTTWSTVGSGPALTNVQALAAFDPDGAGPLTTRLYAVGRKLPPGTADQVSAWDGASWTSVSGTFGPGVRALQAFDPDGAGPAPALLFAGGYFSSVGGAPADGSAYWNGTAWTAIAFNGPEHEFYGFAVHDEDGAGPLPPSLFAGGELESSTIDGVARWTGSAWAAVGVGVGGKVQSLASFDDGVHGPKLVAGGFFSHAGAVATQNIAQWDAQGWSPLLAGNGINSQNVSAMCTFDDGAGRALYVAGEIQYAGPLHVSNVARWDGTSWSALGSGVDGAVLDMLVFDDGSGSALYVAGALAAAGGMPASHVARWNGTSWSAVGSGLDGAVRALTVFDAGSGPRLYAGGEFSGHVARWDGASWSVVEGGTTDTVNALVGHDDGSGFGPALYVGGTFTTAGGVPANRIARWKPGQWSALGLGVTQGVDVLASFDPGTGPLLVVGGPFLSSNGGPPGHLTSWTSAGWHPIANGVGGPAMFQPFIGSLFVHDDGSGGGPALYVGGNFTAIGSVPTANLARFDGTSWTAVDGGVDAEIDCMASFDDGHGPGAALFVGGILAAAGTTASNNIARLGGCGSIGATVCAGDGSGAACPCGNASAAGSEAGCSNSLGTGGRLSATGFASLGGDDVVLTGTGMPDSFAIYLQGTSALGNQSGVAFGDGLRCAGGNVVRLGTHLNVNGASRHPVPGARVSVQGGVTSPGPRVYQVWYRNAAGFCTPSTFNLSNGLRILWVN